MKSKEVGTGNIPDTPSNQTDSTFARVDAKLRAENNLVGFSVTQSTRQQGPNGDTYTVVYQNSRGDTYTF